MTTSMEMKHINQVNSSHCQSQYLPGDTLLTANPGNFATATLSFSSHNTLFCTIQLSLPFLQKQLLFSCWILTSSHAQTWFPYKNFPRHISTWNLQNSHKMVVILTDYHPSKSTSSLAIVTDGRPNIADG